MGPHQRPAVHFVVSLVVDLKEIPIEPPKRPQGVSEVGPIESGILLRGELAELLLANRRARMCTSTKSRAAARPKRANVLSAANSSVATTGPNEVSSYGRIRAS